MDGVGLNKSDIVQEMLQCFKTNVTDQHEQSNVARFYQHRSVFITGASGFIGKTLLEKLLRSCPQINKIYILMRPKRGKEITERLRELTQSEIFDRIKTLEDGTRRLEKIVPVKGDITLPKLGVSDDDLARMARDVSLIFHSAATVKFQEPMRQAIGHNVISVRNLLDLAVKLDKLEGLIHVSTAYSNCDRREVKEVFYKSPIEPNKLIEMADWMDTDTLERISPSLIASRPNTYTYTKAVAESLLVSQINKQLPDLPVAVVRPSIVAGAWREPITGWVDNYNGPTGVLLSIVTGLIQAMRGNPAYCADIVPVDIVSNLLICTAWYLVTSSPHRHDKSTTSVADIAADAAAGTVCNGNVVGAIKMAHNHQDHSKTLAQDELTTETNKCINDDKEIVNSRIEIFNCVSGSENPVTWRQFAHHTLTAAARYPCTNLARYPGSHLISNYYVYYVFDLLNHRCIAHIMDTFLTLSGKKPKMVPIYHKMEKMVTTLAPFTTNQWKFDSGNVMKLYDRLDSVDRDLFNFDIRQLDWKSYLTKYYVGAKIHVMRDDPYVLPQAIVSRSRLKVINNITTMVFLMIIYYFGLHGTSLESAFLNSVKYLVESVVL